ncbi:MAG: ribosome biogenesis GTPase Der [Nitrospiraceae bacterium]|nr:ribosome biogenesis GTPase Der [Nitrospiraceae bacterium]
MPRPVVAIIGRPNVGKSTLFNRIVGRNLAIVEDLPGVTRDRNYADAEWEGKRFLLVDTGGFEPESVDPMYLKMREQTTLAVEEADIIVFLMDGQQGLLPADLEVAQRLRASGKPVIYAVNKVDGERHEALLPDFYRLGVSSLLPLSSKHGAGFSDLMDELCKILPETPAPAAPAERVAPRIAVIGRPNVGKSSFVNSLLGEDRMIVSPVSGTTRDSVDSVYRYYGREYVLVDTAGIRSRGRISQGVEKYSVMRAMKSVGRCDVALVLLDASEGITEQDERIVGLAHEEGKGVIIILNKWDLVENKEETYKKLLDELQYRLKFAHYAPVLTISAATRQRVTKVFDEIDRVMEGRELRVPTAELNRLFERITAIHEPPIYRGKRVKYYFCTQTGTRPPTFVLFVNYPEGVHFSYLRYIENHLREGFGFYGSPIRLHTRRRREDQAVGERVAKAARKKRSGSGAGKGQGTKQ